MSASEILTKIKFYEGVKCSVSGLFGHFNDCIDISMTALKYNAYELVVNGKPLTAGDFTMKDIYSELVSDLSILDAIIEECNKIIEELWAAYYAALDENDERFSVE